MIFRSVTTRLLLLTACAFVLTTIGILFFSGSHVARLLDANQKVVYSEKIDIIIGILQRTEQRIQATGLPEAYREEFQRSTLQLLNESYIQDNPNIPPSILDSDGNVILAHNLPAGKPILTGADWNKRIGAADQNSGCQCFNVNKHWYIHGYYPDWQWYVVYSIPHDVKYREARALILSLTIIMVTITVIVLLVLSLVLSRILSPIKKLTGYASEITAGNLDQEINLTAHNEFGILAHSFEEMRLAIRSHIRLLEDKEGKLSVILDSIADGVIATDPEGYISRSNKVACALLGSEHDVIIGLRIEDLFHGTENTPIRAAISAAKTVLTTRQPTLLAREILLTAPDGSEHIVTVAASPTLTQDNPDTGIVFVFRDITEETRMREQLQHDRRMEAIGQLAGGVAHDFNNLLTGIAGATDLLELKVGDNPQVRKNINTIRVSTERAAGLTQKLLAFSRKGKHVSTPVNIHTLIDETVSILERSIDKKIAIKTKLDAEYAMVSGDPSQLQSGLLNLCINARDAMPGGGELLITTSNIEFFRGCCEIDANLQPGHYIQVSIHDNGTGIPLEVQQKIFEPFFTTKEVGKGTGLGLAAVYGMVKDHHGHVSFYTEPGQGTVFHIFLPISAEVDNFISQEEDKVIRGNGTILVIDDEDIIRTTATLILENLGYNVLLAQNGQEGADLYRQKQDHIDLVLLDMVMPVMNGREAFELIRAANPEAKIIMSSGFARDLNVADLTSKGLAGFIMKPFSRVRLSQVIGEVLRTNKQH